MGAVIAGVCVVTAPIWLLLIVGAVFDRSEP